MKLKYTRAIIDAIHSGELSAAETQATSIFELQVRCLQLLLHAPELSACVLVVKAVDHTLPPS